MAATYPWPLHANNRAIEDPTVSWPLLLSTSLLVHSSLVLWMGWHKEINGQTKSLKLAQEGWIEWVGVGSGDDPGGSGSGSNSSQAGSQGTGGPRAIERPAYAPPEIERSSHDTVHKPATQSQSQVQPSSAQTRSTQPPTAPSQATHPQATPSQVAHSEAEPTHQTAHPTVSHPETFQPLTSQSEPVSSRLVSPTPKVAPTPPATGPVTSGRPAVPHPDDRSTAIAPQSQPFNPANSKTKTLESNLSSGSPTQGATAESDSSTTATSAGQGSPGQGSRGSGGSGSGRGSGVGSGSSGGQGRSPKPSFRGSGSNGFAAAEGYGSGNISTASNLTPDASTVISTRSSVQAPVNLQLYLSHLQRQIDQRWFPQRQSSSTTVVVLFSITRSGTLQDLSLVSSSGNAEADQAALAAVQQASARFGALPAGYERDSLEIKLTFRLE